MKRTRESGFRPRMRTDTQGFAVVGGLRYRGFDGVVADVWNVQCTAEASGTYESPDPRLFVLLDCTPGGAFAIRQPHETRGTRHDRAGSLSYIPSDVPVVAEAVGLKRLSHLDLHFSEASILRRFGDALDRRQLREPRLNIVDARAAHIAACIAEDCAADVGLHGLYAEGLVNALLARIFEIRQNPSARPTLSDQQLRRVTEHIDAQCFEPVRLSDLADLTGLSESHFSRAFKAATGVPPYRWQMQHRVERAKALLLHPETKIAAVATTAGFADQSHFTRVFKQMVGVTPAVWLKARL